MWSQPVHGKSLYILLNFAVNLKLPKNKVYFKKGGKNPKTPENSDSSEKNTLLELLHCISPLGILIYLKFN